MNVKELSLLLSEYNALSGKIRHTKAEEQRMAYLQTAIAAVRSGASLSEVDQQFLNETERRNGLPLTKSFAVSPEQRQSEQEFRFWKGAIERRDVEGAPMLSHIGTYSGLGFFVPTNFFAKVFESMKAADALLDKDLVTLIRTDNGRPLPVPTMDDTNNDASIIGEAVGASSVDISSANHAKLGAYSFMSRYWQVSQELFQDLDSSLSAVQLFQSFTSKALARGIGRELMTGSGLTGHILGLLPALEAENAPVVTAAGSNASTGGTETGANSLGIADFSTALKTLDSAYLESASIAWLMNRNTLNTIGGIVNKFGDRLNLVQYDDDGSASILGIQVRICPSLDNIGASAVPVILGDCSYWATRIVTPGAADDLGIQVFREAPGLIENGLVALRSKVRADGALLWNGNGPSPFVAIRNHS